MRWRKLGRVYQPDGNLAWAQSHAYLPTAFSLDAETIRVFVAFLDDDRVGRLGYVDVSARDPRRVLGVSPRPALDLGEAGTFDDSGISPSSLVEHEGRLSMYYVGWQRGVKARYFLYSGLAISTDGGGSFERASQVPVLDRSDGELFVRSAPHVMRDREAWRMWYVAGDRWVTVNGQDVPTYDIRYLESADGRQWGRQGRVVVELERPDEYGFGRPFVRRSASGYQMWYSIRSVSRGYTLGYAESTDGLHWMRKDDQAGLSASDEGWDSSMAVFACVHDTAYGTYMFYNGNNYGETGFGVAILEA